MDYRIIAADASIGQIQVTYSNQGEDIATYAIDVPLVDGAFITGTALETEILWRQPTWLISRKAEVASATNFSSIESLIPAAPVEPVTTADYTRAVQSALDSKARERNYDGILSACTYATSGVPKFQAEGQACVAWRDAVWAYCYDVLAQVQAQTLPQPTVAALVAGIPQLTWPA